MLGDEILYPFAWAVAFNKVSLCMALADWCGFAGQTPCARSQHHRCPRLTSPSPPRTGNLWPHLNGPLEKQEEFWGQPGLVPKIWVLFWWGGVGLGEGGWGRGRGRGRSTWASIGIQGALDHDKGQKSAISGRRLHCFVFSSFFSSGCFSLFSRFV